MYINVACLKNRAESAPTSSLFDQRNTISWLKKKKKLLSNSGHEPQEDVSSVSVVWLFSFIVLQTVRS